VEVFATSTGRNSAADDKFPREILPRTFHSGFRAELMDKDLKLCMAEAQRLGVPMVLGATVAQLWSLATGLADDGADITDYARMIEDWAGVVMADEGADG